MLHRKIKKVSIKEYKLFIYTVYDVNQTLSCNAVCIVMTAKNFNAIIGDLIQEERVLLVLHFFHTPHQMSEAQSPWT